MKLIDLFFESELDEYRSSYSNGRIDSTKFKPGTRVSHPLMGPNLGTIVDATTIPIEDRRSTGVPVKPDRTNKIYWLSAGSLEILSENTQPKPDTVAKTWDQMKSKEKSSGVKGRTEWNPDTRKYRTVFDVPAEKKPEQNMSEALTKSDSIPDWTALGEDLTVEDKISIFEAYYANGAILESDGNSVEYFKGLDRFSVEPVKNKKYIVTPLMLIQNRVLSLNTELLKLTFVESVGNQLLFAKDDGTTMRFPESHQSNQGLAHTFVFNKISTYDKFRTELSLKFDVSLPDTIGENRTKDRGVAEAEGDSEGLPHLTPKLATNISRQIDTEGPNAIVKSVTWGDGAADELLAKIKEMLDDYASTVDESAAWQKKSGKNKNGGLNQKGVDSYRREHPGSKLQTAVTTKPSKLKPGGKAAKRRKSFCARMGGMKGPMKDEHGKPTRKALALRKWNCESVEQFDQMLESCFNQMDVLVESLRQTVLEGKKVDSFVDAVKKSEIKAGHAAKEAESIAWATANKRGMLNNKKH